MLTVYKTLNIFTYQRYILDMASLDKPYHWTYLCKIMDALLSFFISPREIYYELKQLFYLDSP